jgi:hypothetical protein
MSLQTNYNPTAVDFLFNGGLNHHHMSGAQQQQTSNSNHQLLNHHHHNQFKQPPPPQHHIQLAPNYANGQINTYINMANNSNQT